MRKFDKLLLSVLIVSLIIFSVAALAACNTAVTPQIKVSVSDEIDIRVGDGLDSVRKYLSVVYLDGDGNLNHITDYVLQGDIVEGVTKLTITYNGISAAFDINVKPAITVNTSSGLEYSPADGGNAYAVRSIGTCKDEHIVIPETYQGKEVMGISESAFMGCIGLKSVVIPNGVTSIAMNAFYACADLEAVAIPQTLQYIGDNAFWGCLSLRFNYYGNAKYLGNDDNPYLYLFSAVSSGITSCDVNADVRIIGNGAFRGCSELTEMIFPDSVIQMGTLVFSGCDKLTSVTLSDNIEYINGGLFFGCTRLSNVIIPDNVVSIGASAFYNCSSLTALTIPDGVTYIGNAAFYNCSGLQNIVIPVGVDEIQEKTFYACWNLSSVSLGNVKSIGKNAFSDCGLTSDNMMSITIPDTVISIGDGAFSGCTNIQNVIIPDSVTQLGTSVFSGCSNLTSATLGKGVTAVPDYTFNNCYNLSQVQLEGAVVSIGTCAFCYCKKLTNFDFADSVEMIGAYAFQFSSLKEITFGSGLSVIDNEAFGYCKITDVVIPRNVLNVGKDIFRYCDDLRNIEFLGTVEEWIEAIGGNTLNSSAGCTVVCSDGEVQS